MQIYSNSKDLTKEYYELEAVNNAWNGRELERQIHSQLYERLAAGSDNKQEEGVEYRSWERDRNLEKIVYFD